ncbi:MAG: L-dopachrome tautomerase-related protein [Phycisphaerales bacterium]
MLQRTLCVCVRVAVALTVTTCAIGIEPPPPPTEQKPVAPANKPVPAPGGLPSREAERGLKKERRARLTAATAEPRLEEVATSSGRQWTGVAVSKAGRMFVSYPRWESAYVNAVEEIKSDGTRVAFPSADWNVWKPETGAAAGAHFVCVQSVHVDAKERLWILDPGAPKLGEIVPGAPKLVCVDLGTNEVVRVYAMGEAAPKGSYLNDVRVDAARDVAYITDSGRGAIVVVDLGTGASRRVLDGAPCVRADADVVPEVEGRELKMAATGEPLRVNSDGIALSRDGQWLYWQALTGRTLWRAPAAALRDAALTTEQMVAKVENLGQTVVTDGMEIDERGNLYFAALEYDAVVCRTPDGHLVRLAGSPLLAWPDSFAWGPDGSMYVTTSQIHRTKWFRSGESGDDGMPREPYRLLKMQWGMPAGQTVVLQVKGMMCELCEGKVAAALKKLDGVKDVKASHTDGRVVVVLKPGAKTKAVEMCAVVKGLEYEAREYEPRTK